MLYNVYFGLKFIYYKDKCLCIKHYDNFFVWKKLENCRCADSDTKKWQWEEWYWRSGVSPDRASVRVLQPGHGYNTLSGMTWWISFPLFYKIQLLWSLDSDVRLSSQLFPCKIAFSKEWPPLFLFISFQLNRIFIYYTLLLMYSVSYFQRYKFNLTDSIICNYILPFIYSVYLFLFTHFSSCSFISQIFLP